MFLDLDNLEEVQRTIEYLDQGKKDMETLSRPGNGLAELSVHLLDPLNVLGVGPFKLGGTVVLNAAKSSIRAGQRISLAARLAEGSIDVGAAVSIAEAASGAANPFKTKEQAMTNIGVGTILGGTLGALVGRRYFKGPTKQELADDLTVPAIDEVDPILPNEIKYSDSNLRSDTGIPEGETLEQPFFERMEGSTEGKPSSGKPKQKTEDAI